jgi:uncharacterized membrane protein
MFSGRKLLTETWNSLAGRWSPVLITFWAAMVCQGIPSAIPKVGGYIGLLLSGPFCVGLGAYGLAIHRDKHLEWESLLQGFERPVRETLAFLMLLGLFLIGILLFVVPAILWMLSYSQTFFILADHPEMTARQAMQRSRELMYGHRLELAKLHLWQTGLFLLSSATLFIACLWLFPFFLASLARFYENIKVESQTVPV